MPIDLPFVDLNPLAPGAHGWFRMSLPLPAGEAQPDQAWSLQPVNGEGKIHLQTRPLATWPDGSVRWLDAQGLADQAGNYAWCRETAPPPATPAWIEEVGDGIEMGTGDLMLCLSKAGPSPIASVQLHGNPLTAAEALGCRLRIDGHEDASFQADGMELCIRERGPVRVVADVDGWLATSTSERLFRYRLRVTVVAGQPTLSLAFRLTHACAGSPLFTVQEARLTLHGLPTGNPRHHLLQSNHTLLCRPREIVTEMPVEIRSGLTHTRVQVSDVAVFGEIEPWPLYMPDNQESTEPFLGIASGTGWLTAAPRDFRELTPKGLTAEAARLTFQLHPKWADPTDWPQGRARECTLDVVCTADQSAPTTPTLRRLTAAVQDHGVARLPASWYAACECWGMESVLGAATPAPRRFDRYLRKLGTMPTILGMWELGDTLDMGYTRTYAASRNSRPRTEPGRPYFCSINHFPLVEWSGQLSHEPVWANNEYDAILALAREWMRTAPSAEHWQRLRWFARHAVEVDFVSFSDSRLLHHGTPAHSADHQRATAYPSHLWAEGLLAWYCLSGDNDALDVAIMQGDFILGTFAEAERRGTFWGFNRELGWALLHLAALVDLTGEERFRTGMQELAAGLTSEPINDATVQQMALYAFGFGSITLGVHATWRLTRDAELADWLVKTAERVGQVILDEGSFSLEPHMNLLYFTIAYQVTGDPEQLRPGLHILEHLMDSKQWYDPKLEAKPVAMLHRALATWLGPAQQHGLLDGLDFRHYPAS